MEEISENLYVGAESSCNRFSGENKVIIHACKHPCHQNAVGYSKNLSSNHPDYLIKETESDLYLNIVDMERKQSHEFMEPILSKALEFMDDKIDSNEVLVHCNEGRSRSPSIAMLYLAKRIDTISDQSYSKAAEEFNQLYPKFNPTRGIMLYLRDYWNQID